MTDQQVPSWANMFEFPKVYLDAIKMVGTGNAAGLLAALAAFGSSAMRPELLLHLKGVGFLFFCGLNLFLLALVEIYSQFLQYNHSLVARFGWGDQHAAQSWYAASFKSGNRAYGFTKASVLFFAIGMFAAVVLFVRL